MIRRFTVNPLGENCYVLSDSTKEGVIIDCGTFDEHEFSMIRQYVENEGIRLKHYLLTHAHFDHIFGSDNVYEAFGLRPECHETEREIWQMNPTLTYRMMRYALPLPKVEPLFTLEHGTSIQYGTSTLRVIHTPGHTPGGLCFYLENEGLLLSGDTLFRFSLGRTDIPLGSMEQEVLSVRNSLMTLPPKTIVYPGHGDTTTIAEERDGNPFL